MKRNAFPVILLLLLASAVSAQQIELNTEQVDIVTQVQTIERTLVTVGDVTVTNGEKGVGVKEAKAKAIKIETSVPVDYIQAFGTDLADVPVVKIGESAYLLAAPPGVYRVQAHSVEHGCSRSVAVKIDGLVEPVPDKPDLPPGEDPGKKLTELSAELADKVNDPPTRQALAASLKAISWDGVDFDGALAAVESAVDSALQKRRGASMQKEWKAGWLVPVDGYLASLDIDTVEGFKLAIDAIVAGLEKSAPAAAVSTNGVPAGYRWARVQVGTRCVGGTCYPVYENRLVRDQ